MINNNNSQIKNNDEKELSSFEKWVLKKTNVQKHYQQTFIVPVQNQMNSIIKATPQSKAEDTQSEDLLIELESQEQAHSRCIIL